jgi:uncharacterized membrane protein YwzB
MEDELKRFTQQHRRDFEVFRLDIDDAWYDVERRLARENFFWKHMSKVAAILLVLITIAIGYCFNDQRMEINRYGPALKDLSSELAETDAYYAMKIDENLEMIWATSGYFDPGLLAQMEVFDDEYRLLKKDMKDNADSEEVINAMIEHYRLKLKTLEKILEEIQKDHDRTDDEKIQAI